MSGRVAAAAPLDTPVPLGLTSLSLGAVCPGQPTFPEPGFLKDKWGSQETPFYRAICMGMKNYPRLAAKKANRKA